jgi:hypothetical protein
MGFVKYDRNLKVIAIKMSRRGMTLAEINVVIEKKISLTPSLDGIDYMSRLVMSCAIRCFIFPGAGLLHLPPSNTNLYWRL